MTASLFATSSASSTKPLWAAVGVLSVGVFALGASLVHISGNSVQPKTASVSPALPMGSAMAMGVPAAPGNAAENISSNQKYRQNTALEPTNNAPTAPKIIAKTSSLKTAPVVIAAKPSAPTVPASPGVDSVPVVYSGNPPVAQGTSAGQSMPQPVGAVGTPVVLAQAPVVSPVPAKPACVSCGTIEAVTPVVRSGQGGMTGVLAGGAVGAVLGNQMGKGSGRAVATILGAVGGAVAGNAIDKSMHKETVYSVRVRMEDGSVRTVEQAQAPAVGAKVTLEGNVLRSADGGTYTPAPEPRPRVATQAREPNMTGG